MPRSATPRPTADDARTIELVKSRARSLKAAKTLIGTGLCKERAEAAFDEAAAILEDAAGNCVDLTFVTPEDH